MSIFCAYPCRCGSCWCPQCAKHSKTHTRIQERLEDMRWDLVRHIILTCDRKAPPAATYDAIRIGKSIPRLIRSLKLSDRKWIWVLEFHADGYPHWHLLIENRERRMIGHDRIRQEWVWGHVWESPIKGREHWDKIKGYHRHKGYLAGEAKRHQLTLPEHFHDRSRIRKFGGHQKKSANVPRGTLAPKTRQQAEPYGERFKTCGDYCRIRIGSQWGLVLEPAAIVQGLADRYLGDMVNGAYEADPDAIAYVLSQVDAYTNGASTTPEPKAESDG